MLHAYQSSELRIYSLETVQVRVSGAAREAILANGGEVYVWMRSSRCCGGAVTELAVSLVAPREAQDFEDRVVDGLRVNLSLGRRPPPEEILVDVRGRRRRLEAYWDGCLFVT